jgi:hypothetical protein
MIDHCPTVLKRVQIQEKQRDCAARFGNLIPVLTFSGFHSYLLSSLQFRILEDNLVPFAITAAIQLISIAVSLHSLRVLQELCSP